MPPGVLPVNYMQCVNEVGCRLTKLTNFPEEDRGQRTGSD